ncbi:MAG: DUF3536 domain-containing protein [Desulfobacterota bacterium]|nr:DUF3536 domain-containing protein [Thermodesulfobacteriota bacterium]
MNNTFLCIHGHFYQPPRENPWLEEIEQQESAYPFHDWNERICAECYAPNTHARILDSEGKIFDIVNNFATISFNVGPTLMSWLERKAPEVYAALLEADLLSLARWGHGNAIAQAYNHIILPLAQPHDRDTQIIWGIEDFRFRFKRDPEALWLPETAVNEATLEALHRHNMKFVILSPTQAATIRQIGSTSWHDVSNGSIDPRRPYRCFLAPEGTGQSERYIDIFFYDGMLASDVSFGGALADGETFARRLHDAAGSESGEARLVHCAVDGETFGHHRRYGEMTLAYALRTAQERYGFELINYGSFLERFPPQWEVKIKQGPNGEGTAWSCCHGLGRWKEDCGCRVPGPPTWNQQWRAPLREAITALRAALMRLYEREAPRYFIDAAAARNAYVRVIMQRSDEQRERFFTERCVPDLSTADKTAALTLLEMERHALLMQTSCGWFFNELSGIETTAILKYADRAMQLAAAVSPEDIETPFVEKLAQAKSNIPGFGTGRDIFYRMVRPCRIDMRQVLNHAIITDAFYRREPLRQTVYCYDIEMLERSNVQLGDKTVYGGRARVTARTTTETREYLYVLVWHAGGMCRSVIQHVMPGMDGSTTLRYVLGRCAAEPDRLYAIMQECFGEGHFSLRDMFAEERQRILSTMLAKEIEACTDVFARMYDNTRHAVETAIGQGFVAPWEFKKAAENTIRCRLVRVLERLRDDIHDTENREAIRTMLHEAALYGYQLDLSPFLQLMERVLREQFLQLHDEFAEVHCDEMQDVVACVRAARVEEIGAFIDYIRTLPVAVDMTVPQNIFFRLLHERLLNLQREYAAGNASAGELMAIMRRLAEKLGFSPNCPAVQGHQKGVTK